MKTVRRLLYGEILGAIAFVTVAFLSLFFFIDFLDELSNVGQGGVTTALAALTALASLPQRLYEVLPITVLIGTIYALARLAHASEFTILRTSGLDPQRALRLLCALGLVLAALTYAVGEYVAPWSQQALRWVQPAPSGAPNPSGGHAAWLREQIGSGDGAAQRVIRVGAVSTGGAMSDVELMDFDAQGRLVQRIDAASATLTTARDATAPSHQWQLTDVTRSTWPSAAASPLTRQHLPALAVPTTLTAALVSAAVAPVDGMSTQALWRYTQHLSAQGQATQRQELTLWRRLLYPLACLVMMALALPFAYLQARSGGLSYKVFGGILLGISFVLLNNTVADLGVLRGWTPWLAALAPSVLYLGLAMAAFAWIVRRR